MRRVVCKLMLCENQGVKFGFGKFVLDDDGKPLELGDSKADLLLWAQWFETHNRHVKKTKIGNVTVSTVFLGLDHGFGYSDKPVLWETMIFGSDHFDGFQRRYTSKEDAEKGHDEAVLDVEAQQYAETMPSGRKFRGDDSKGSSGQ